MRKFTCLLILQLLFTFTLPAVSPAGEVADRMSIALDSPTPVESKVVAATDEKTEEAAPKTDEKWERYISIGARAVDSSKDTNRYSRELINLEDGAGIEELRVRRLTPQTDLRFEASRVGSWNGSYGTTLDYRDGSRSHLRVRRSRSDTNFGSIAEPGILRDRLNLNLTYDRSELKYRPRVVFSFRGMDTRGDILRSQGNLDQYTPKARIQETFEPTSQDWNLSVFGGQGKFDMGVTTGLHRNNQTTVKTYMMDMPQSTVPRFDGVTDLYTAWRYQDNRSRTFGTKFSYAFNDMYKATVQLDWGWIDNNFDLVRHQVNGATIRSSNLFGLQGQQQGWLDGFTRTERYTLEGNPNDKWEFVTNLERRRSRLRADGALVTSNAAGVVDAQDLAATQNQMDEGSWDFRADYKGWKDSRAYVGWRILEREEFDNDQLATYSVLGGISTPVATTRARVQFLNRLMRERMGFVGFWHRFNPKLELDIFHEAGGYDDRNSGVVAGVNQRSLVQDYKRSRTGASVRYRPNHELNYFLKAHQTVSDREDIHAEDKERSVAFFANWAPAGRKYTVGGGYTRTDSDVTLLGMRYRDQIETLNANLTYQFNKRLLALLDYSNTQTDDVTNLDYQQADLRFKYALPKDRDITLGISNQRYRNKNWKADDFDNRVFLFTYGIKH